MPTLAENLLVLKAIQVAIKDAIEAKGVAVGDAPFADYPDLIADIESGPTTTDAFWEGGVATWGATSTTWGEE